MTPEGKRRQHQRVRLAAIMALGGRCACGFSDIRALEIDHVDGNGKEARKQHTGTSYYYHVLKTLASVNYQVLCANCHAIKTYWGEG